MKIFLCGGAKAREARKKSACGAGKRTSVKQEERNADIW